MEIDPLYAGMIVFIVIALAVSFGLFYYLVLSKKNKPSAPRTVAPLPTAPQSAPQALPSSGAQTAKPPIIPFGKKKTGFEIPPYVPRTLATIKMMAEERPDLVVKVIRRWLSEDILRKLRKKK